MYMAVTLAPLAPDIPHYGIYNHTGGACMPPKDPAPPVSLRLPVRLNILWPSEQPREQPSVFCWSVHMCESNGSLLRVQMAGSMCAVVGPSARHGFELKKSHLVRLRRLHWPSSQLRVLETCCTWRKQFSRRGSRVAARRKKITRQLREASSAASSRAATRSRSFHSASMLPPSSLLKTVYGGKGEDVAPGASTRGIKGPQAACRSAALARPSQTYP